MMLSQSASPLCLPFSLFVVVCYLVVTELEAVRIDDFYPFGKDNNDNFLVKADDEASDMVVDVKLDRPFQFYGKEYTSIGVLTNGLLRLDDSDVTNNFRPRPFPTFGALIAPFWADVDTRGSGRVFYRSTVEENLLDKMSNDIRYIFGTLFIPRFLFIATWYKVGYYNKRTDKTNTFQCVLGANGNSSFVLFLYKKGGMQWAAGEPHVTRNTKEHFATVGLNAGDGQNYTVLPGSNEATVLNIEITSNVGIPGLWAYQINPMQAHSKDKGTIDPLPDTDSGTTRSEPATSLFKRNTWLIVIILILVLILLLLPGAVIGYVKVGRAIKYRDHEKN